jgi:hypothetical protein
MRECVNACKLIIRHHLGVSKITNVGNDMHGTYMDGTDILNQLAIFFLHRLAENLFQEKSTCMHGVA